MDQNVFMKYFVNVFTKKYAKFDGRASRQEYWMFYLFTMLFSVGLIFLEKVLGIGRILFGIYWLVLIIPSLAIMVRRLHDIGKSGCWYFISWIPLVGGIWLLVLLCTQSQEGENQYGNLPFI